MRTRPALSFSGLWIIASSLAIGAVVGVIVGAVGVRTPGEPLPPPGDRVSAAIAGLEQDHFYVAPELADRLTDAQRTAISDALDEADAPSYVVWWTSTTDAGYYLDSDALDQIMAGVGDGRFAIIDDTLAATDDARGMDDAYVDSDVLVARPDAALLAYASAMAAEPEEPASSTSDYYGGPVGGFFAGLLLAVAAFLGLLVLIGIAGLLRPNRRETHMSIDDATVAAIEKALQTDGLYVDPTLAGQLPAPVQQQIREAIAGSPTPVYVVAVPLSYDDPVYQGRPELLFGTIHSDLGLDGVYIGVRSDTSPVQVATTSFGPTDGTYAELGANAKAEAVFPGDLGQTILTTIGLVASGDGEAVFDQYHPTTRSGTGGTSQPGDPTGSSGSSGDDGGFGAIGIASVVIAVLALAVVTARVRRRLARRVGRPASLVTARPFELPKSVLTTIRATQDDQLEKRAGADVLALGERIRTNEISSSAAPSVQSSWQAALDHYDLADRILDREHSAADVVGVIVLAGRGQQALGDALAGHPYVPKAPCYLNPLHGPGIRPTVWKGPQGEVTVPLCAACARAVRAGQEPADVLDFMVRGEPRHYYEIDVEPWSSTGYGALDPDLLARLFSGPR